MRLKILLVSQNQNQSQYDPEKMAPLQNFILLLLLLIYKMFMLNLD